MRVSVSAAPSPKLEFVSALVADRLRRRVRTTGAEPLITYYEVDTGVRTELSVVTFVNWVDKTCNLVTDELLLETGAVVELAVAGSHPGHWVTACWQVACWQLGLTVSVGSGLPPDLVVTGPDWNGHLEAGVDVLACSMHPLGLGLGAPPPAGVTDYALEVRGQPDGFVATPQSGLRLAWADAERRVTQADLLELDSPSTSSGNARRLVQPSDPWTTARDGIVSALVSGGSVVQVVGGDDAQLARIVADERVTRSGGSRD